MVIEYLKRSGSFLKWLVPLVLSVFLLFGCSSKREVPDESQAVPQTAEVHTIAAAYEAVSADKATTAADEAKNHEIDRDGSYTTKEEVALYIHTYKKLPGNFITKKQAEKAGWVSKEENLWEVAPGKSIGGSRFGNYEGQLPEKEGRDWQECDIDFEGEYRNAKRILYSDDGLIYYTEDHYKTFEQLY